MGANTRGSSTTETQIEVLWSALTATDDLRGAAIQSYHLQWDAGTTGVTWSDLTGFAMNFLRTNFVVTSGLEKDRNYQFRVRAKNAFGFGAWSDPAIIRTSDKPEQMA